jgi:hypothetical protein
LTQEKILKGDCRVKEKRMPIYLITDDANTAELQMDTSIVRGFQIGY